MQSTDKFLDNSLLPSNLNELISPKTPVKLREESKSWWVASRMLNCIIKLLYLMLRLSASVLPLVTKNPKNRARIIRETLEDLGIIWIKLGQFLALRRDLFALEFCQELSKLQDKALAMNESELNRILKHFYGQRLVEIFEYFDNNPVASASIAQVHRCRLNKESIDVAVKVLKPEALDHFRKDLKLFRGLISIFEFFDILKEYRWKEMFFEIKEMIETEGDFLLEASNLEKMRESLSSHDIYVPYVFYEYSSSNILVMEFIDGLTVSEFERVRVQDPKELEKWCKKNNINVKTVAENLISSQFRQIHYDNLFHGDLHPGNVLLLKNSKIAFIDFGNIGFLDNDFLSVYRQHVFYVVQGNFSQAVDKLLLICRNLPANRLSQIKSQLVQIFKKWYSKNVIVSNDFQGKSLSTAIENANKLLYSNGIQIDWSFFRAARAIGNLDMTLSIIYPELNYINLTKRFFEKHRAKLLLKALRRFAFLHDELFDLVDSLRTNLVRSSFDLKRKSNIFELIVISFLSTLRFILPISLLGLFATLFDNYFGLNKLSVVFLKDIHWTYLVVIIVFNLYLIWLIRIVYRRLVNE